jgi:MOSC domain-containing protein YiiM
MAYKILGVFTGKVAKLTNNKESAIIKHLVDVITLSKKSINEDTNADKRYHGGEMRVVHHYSQKHYNYLKEKFPEIAEKFIPGSFGENILTEELTEDELNIGDIYQLGTAKVQLTVCRRPCATINYAYNDKRILKEIMATGRTGWFYRILEEGEVRTGDQLVFLERPYPNLPLSKLHQQGYGKERFSDINFLERCYQTGLMDKDWKPRIQKTLEL